MQDLRVPTNCLPVEIRCVNGRSVLGDIFLPAYSSRHSGPMGAEEWTETVPHFFPVRSRVTGTTTLLNRDAVVAVSVPVPLDDQTEAACLDCPVTRVAVEAGTDRFEGDIVVDMPPGQRRVLDWLNAHEGFLTVRTPIAHHLIHKRHITSVVELDRTAA